MPGYRYRGTRTDAPEAAPAPVTVVYPPDPDRPACGRESTYRYHNRRKEPIDEACREAARAAERIRYHARKNKDTA